VTKVVSVFVRFVAPLLALKQRFKQTTKKRESVGSEKDFEMLVLATERKT
jgi:hypothetical protein